MSKRFKKIELFQWPEPAFCKFINKKLITYKFKNPQKKPNQSKIKKIEEFFKRKYQVKFAILLPSGRAGINNVLKYFNFNRSKVVNVPMWSSSCLLHSLTSMTNVTVKNNNADCNIIVHKWGYTYNLKKKKKLIIDDSADCFPGNEYKPFENSSVCEILSLPKLIGSYCGGVVLTNRENIYKFLKKQQKTNKKLGISQSKKKYFSTFIDSENFDWRYYESLNSFVDYNAVENIFKCINNFDVNLKIIKDRQRIVKNYFNIIFDKKRVGPCIIFKKNKFKYFKSVLETKNFDFTLKANNEKYEHSYIFPIHFGIPNKIFEDKLKNLVKAKRHFLSNK